jgi:hypothetical protein
MHELHRLDPLNFEHLAMSLALRELGAGVTTFAPGKDGGRDGYFEGSAPYPSTTNKWSGVWYLQSKFHSPHLTANAQSWLLTQVRKELEAFARADSQRTWPDNWILITNVDPSAAAHGGAFDQIRDLVRNFRGSLVNHFHIWGARKIEDLLTRHQDVARRYGHFLTSGDVISALIDHIKAERVSVDTIMYHLIVKRMEEQQFAKLEQAGSQEYRPGIHRLFTDVPFVARDYELSANTTQFLHIAAQRSHRPDTTLSSAAWQRWRRHPSRARIWFLRGGPGQGKSTIAQYLAQVQRAWFVLNGNVRAAGKQQELAAEIRASAEKLGVWPQAGRIPVLVELKDFAQWMAEQKKRESRSVLSYLAKLIAAAVDAPVTPTVLRSLLSEGSWYFVFDGLDEVPADAKSVIASEIQQFLDHVVVETDADLFAVCTSRPQGYSGQFNDLDACMAELLPLTVDQAIECAKPVIALLQSREEAERDITRLRKASERQSIRELMVTPLQSHIMAIVVRGGARPPDRRWKLFNNFYEVIRKREATRDLPDERLARVLREEEVLLKTIHNRVGFALQALSETSSGAQAALPRPLFERIAYAAVEDIKQREIEPTAKTLMNATTERLVLVNTPDDGNHVRFDVRQLQEFFAAEFLYDSVDAAPLAERVELIAADAHWREVAQFLVSGLIEGNRQTELEAAANVLQRIDSGDIGDLRGLTRKLARGGLLVARLLAEGVLEQDRRVRARLRNALAAVHGATEFAVIEPLLRTKQPNSLTWLLDTLLDTLTELQPIECAGASAVLACILPETHERFQTAFEYFDALDPELLALIARCASARGDLPFAPWFIRILMRSLARPESTRLSARAIQSVAREFRRYAEATIQKRAGEAGMSIDDARLMQWLAETSSPKLTPSLASVYGFATQENFATDWHTGDVPRYAARITTHGCTGLLNLLYEIAAFARMKRPEELATLLDSIARTSPLFYNLPAHIKAHVPIDLERDTAQQISILAALEPEELLTLLKKQEIGGRRWQRAATFTLVDRHNATLDQWKKLVEDSPATALKAWSEKTWRRSTAPAVLERREATKILLERVLREPVVALNFPGLWGRLLGAAGTRENELRRGLRGVPHRTTQRVYPTELSPVEIQLPQDAPLLPDLLSAIFVSPIVGDRTPDFTEVSDFVAALTPLAHLREFRDSAVAPRREHLAACVLSWLHPGGECLDEDSAALGFLASPECDSESARVVVDALLLLAHAADPRSRTVVSEVIDLLRGRARDRDLIDPLIAKWREHSAAPISAARQTFRWLNIARKEDS